MHSKCLSQGARLSIFGLAAMVTSRKRYEPSQAVLLQQAIILLWKKIILGRSMSASTRFAPRTAGVSTSCLFCIA